MDKLYMVVKEISERFECDEIPRRKQISSNVLLKLVIQAMEPVQQIEERILIRCHAVAEVQPEEAINGGGQGI
jgi:hypothetical protein